MSITNTIIRVVETKGQHQTFNSECASYILLEDDQYIGILYYTIFTDSSLLQMRTFICMLLLKFTRRLKQNWATLIKNVYSCITTTRKESVKILFLCYSNTETTIWAFPRNIFYSLPPSLSEQVHSARGCEVVHSDPEAGHRGPAAQESGESQHHFSDVLT